MLWRGLHCVFVSIGCCFLVFLLFFVVSSLIKWSVAAALMSQSNRLLLSRVGVELRGRVDVPIQLVSFIVIVVLSLGVVSSF